MRSRALCSHGPAACLRNDKDLFKGKRFPFRQESREFTPEIACTRAAGFGRRQQLVVLRAVGRVDAKTNGHKELREFAVVILRPLIERVLVALGALNADSQKRVGES